MPPPPGKLETSLVVDDNGVLARELVQVETDASGVPLIKIPLSTHGRKLSCCPFRQSAGLRRLGKLARLNTPKP